MKTIFVWQFEIKSKWTRKKNSSSSVVFFDNRKRQFLFFPTNVSERVRSCINILPLPLLLSVLGPPEGDGVLPCQLLTRACHGVFPLRCTWCRNPFMLKLWRRYEGIHEILAKETTSLCEIKVGADRYPTVLNLRGTHKVDERGYWKGLKNIKSSCCILFMNALTLLRSFLKCLPWFGQPT